MVVENKTEKYIISETEKWLSKVREERKKLCLIDMSRQDMIKNIDAYISDAEHFLEKKDYMRAFEAVIWSWAWIEILAELGIIEY